MLVVEGWTENVRAGKFRRRGRAEAATAEAAMLVYIQEVLLVLEVPLAAMVEMYLEGL